MINYATLATTIYKMKKENALLIKPDCRVSELQKEFNLHFPYLKLEFFKHPHELHGGNPRKDLVTADISLRLKHKNSPELLITEDMKVSTLEQLFSEHFGLSAQVFRKSGRSWLETTMTDDWTLRRQNDEGSELSKIA
jgi:hypothetical protein